MSKKIIQSIVIILSILILLAFLAIIYGMYLKISISTNKPHISESIFSAQLENNQKIKNIEVIDKNNLFLLIEHNYDLFGLIYDIKNNKIIRKIDR